MRCVFAMLGHLAFLDRRPICCNSVIRDSGSRQEGYRYCGEGPREGQTWQVGMRTGSRAWVTEGGGSNASWTQLAADARW
jgi:hypothetical protein